MQLKTVAVIGPTEPAVAKINDIYRKVLYLKCGNYDTLVEIKDSLEQYLEKEPFGNGLAYSLISIRYMGFRQEKERDIMALRTIRIQGDEVLNKRCREVTEMTPRIATLIEDMIETMDHANGVGTCGMPGRHLKAYRSH